MTKQGRAARAKAIRNAWHEALRYRKLDRVRYLLIIRRLIGFMPVIVVAAMVGCNPSWKSAGILKQGVVDCVVTQGTYTWGRTCYRGHGGRNVWVSTETCTINQKTGEHYDCLVQKWESDDAKETG